MSIRKKLQDPQLGEEEKDSIIGAFVRRFEEDRLRKRYTEQLLNEQGISRSETKEQPPSVHNKKRRGLSWPYYLAIAASIAFLVITLSWSTNNNNNELISSYLSEDLLVVPIFRGVDSISNATIQLRQRMLQNFRDGNFEMVVQGADSIQQKDSTTLFFLAHSFLRLEQYVPAQQTFQQLIQQGNYSKEAKWYSVLIELQLGNREEGLSALKRYQPKDPFYTKAQDIIKTLE